MKNKILSILLFCSIFISNITPACAYADPISVSLIQVIANPEKYDGKDIQLIGYFHIDIDFDEAVLCLHKEDYNNSIVLNTFWIDVDNKNKQQYEKVNDNYVIIRGIFNKGGHGIHAGGLTNITRCEIWDPIPDNAKKQFNINKN